MTLPPRQRLVLAFILDCWETGWLPANLDIARHLNCHVSSADAHIRALRKKGILRQAGRVALTEEVANDPYSYL